MTRKRAFNALTDAERDEIVRRVIAGDSCADIARDIGRSKSTVVRASNDAGVRSKNKASKLPGTAAWVRGQWEFRQTGG